MNDFVSVEPYCPCYCEEELQVMRRFMGKEMQCRILERPIISKDQMRHIRPATPNPISKITVKQSMMNIFWIPSTNRTFIIRRDVSGANLVPSRQPIDTSPPNKYLNLSRKFEAPQDLPKGFKWVSIRAFRFFPWFNQAMSQMVRAFYSELAPVVTHPD